MLAIVIAEGVAILVLAVLVLGLLRSHALILRALHELGAGLALEDEAQPSPGHGGGRPGPVAVTLEQGVVPATRPETTRGHDVRGTDLDGAQTSVAVGSGRTLLAFLSSGCSVCQTFWDAFSVGDTTVPGGGALAVVAKDPGEESPSRLRGLAGPALDVVQSSGAWTDYAVPGSPYFVYVVDGTIVGEGSATTWAQVRDLMGQAVDDANDARRPGVRSGRDDVVLVDRALGEAGLYPGHPSLYEQPDAERR